MDQGFWAMLDWWLQREKDQRALPNPVPNRVALVARYDAGLDIRRPVDRYMRSEDPSGTLDFVEFGVKRGEIQTTSMPR